MSGHTYSIHLIDAKGQGCYLSVKGRTEWKTKKCARRHAANLKLKWFGAVVVELENQFGEVVETVQRED